MYSSLQIAKKYLHYYLTASNGKGHGIHSPFVFDFIKNVLNDKKEKDCFIEIENIRRNLMKDPMLINVEDFGAGSAVIKSRQRVVKDIAASSLKAKKYAQLLFRMVKYYQPQTIIELGTSFGISTAYMACGNKNALLYTCEGANEIAAIAAKNFQQLGINNIELIIGDFGATLPGLIKKLSKVDFAFIDGNHRKAPTLSYFTTLLEVAAPDTILIFDDIHWSAEMEEAWENIKKHPAVTMSIDLFFIGIIFFKKDFKVPQHFSIRF